MTAVDARGKLGLSHLKSSSKQVVNRRIVFVPARSTPKADSDGFVFPETYFVEPGQVQDFVGWKSTPSRGVGLRNCGNTCYMNSVLQALTHSSALANDALSDRHVSSCPRRQSNMFCGYCQLMTHVKNALTTKGRSEIAPEPILRQLKLISKNMRYGRQEDSHEFLRQLIDSCANGELPIKLTSNPKGPIVPSLVRSTTFVGQLFSGYLQSQITCSSCSNVSRTFDPFMDVSLEIQDSSSLVDCLRRFTRADTLSGQNAYKCSKCQKRVTAKKEMVVHRSPPLLTFQLKRFNLFASRHSAQKINKSIKFGATLDMAPFMSSDTARALNYSLYAVIVHEGSSMGSGHYVAYAKAANGMWYLFNDSSVQQVSEQTVLNQSAYILMYESKDERCFYPSNEFASITIPSTPTSSNSQTVTVSTPEPVATVAQPAFAGVRVINHEDSDGSESECSSSSSEDEPDNLTPTSQLKPLTAQEAFVKNMKAVVRAPARKLLRMITVVKFINKLKRTRSKTVEVAEAVVEEAMHEEPEADEPEDIPQTAEPMVRIETPTHAWGKIPVAAWDGQDSILNDPRFRAVVRSQTMIAEPGARSQYDVEYDEGKSKHNPRSEFASGNGLPESLTAAFNAVAKGDVPRGLQRPFGKGGKGKGKGFGGKGFSGQGKGFGGKGFGGQGKGFGGKGFGGQGKGFGGKGKGFGKGFGGKGKGSGKGKGKGFSKSFGKGFGKGKGQGRVSTE